MSKSEARFLFLTIISINIFALICGIYYQAIPYWAAATLSNAIGLFCGFFIGFIAKIREDKK